MCSSEFYYSSFLLINFLIQLHLLFLILICFTVFAIHGAGGGAWEYSFKWSSVFESNNLSFNPIQLIPSSEGLESTSFDDYIDQIHATISLHLSTLSFTSKLIIIGASMGGMLALKIAERIQPSAVVLICSTYPKEVKDLLLTCTNDITQFMPSKLYPPIIQWANSTVQDTVDSLPDSDTETHLYAASLWRDESGGVLNTIAEGISCIRPTCPVLVVIPEADDTIHPSLQRELARYLQADILSYPNMSHVGPLLSTSAPSVAQDVIDWIRSKAAVTHT